VPYGTEYGEPKTFIAGMFQWKRSSRTLSLEHKVLVIRRTSFITPLGTIGRQTQTNRYVKTETRGCEF